MGDAGGYSPLDALITRHNLHAEPFQPAAMWRVAVQEGWFVGLRSNMGTLLGDGVIYNDGEQQTKMLFVNECLSLPWQRYVIAHELAHELLEHKSVFAKVTGEVDSIQEREADDAAALVLVPACALHLSQGELARYCDVPVGVALRRLNMACVEEPQRKGVSCARGLLQPF